MNNYSMHPNNVQQNGAIASLVAPLTPSSSSREPTPSTSFSPPPSSHRGLASRISLNSPPHHLHLPSYRFVDEDSRPKSALGSAVDCQKCGRTRRRNNTWLEIEAAYDMMDNQRQQMDRYQLESVAERRRHFETAARLQEANNELDRLLEELEAFSCTTSTAASRSKSTPDFNHLNEPSYPTQNDLRRLPPSPSQRRYLYNLRKEELLRRQKAEKLALEIEDQRNRRHGYIPNLSPSLQNDLGRLEQLLNDFSPIEPNDRSTPKLNGTSSSLRSRSLSSNSFRLPLGNNRNTPPLTCTALHRFEAESPRELSLEVGDLAVVRRRINGDWVEGERNGFIGIFPASYVRFNV